MNGDWLIKLLPSWERRHPQLFAWEHIAAGVWLLVLTSILYGYQRGGWWRALLVPAAAGHFYGAYCLLRLRATGRDSRHPQ
jgi:hypothetical protein